MRHLCRGLSAFLVAFVMLAAMPLQAGAQDNTVTITIAGGNATALATCTNQIRERGSGDVEDVEQENECKNVAVASGGDVSLKNVTIVAVATSDEKKSKRDKKRARATDNTVTLTIRGGAADAIADCINDIRERGKGDVEDIEQENECANKAVAKGGDVKLRNVKILAVAKGKRR